MPAAAILALAAGLLAAAAAAQTAPAYVNYPAPGGLGTGAGEPSIGVDARTGKVMFLAGLQTLEVAFDPVTGAASWADATPNDPVQRGTICLGGTSCGSTRNLLDFLDATIDTEGRVLVGFADGCVGACVQGPPSSFSALATIARQSAGQRMYAAFDH